MKRCLFWAILLALTVCVGCKRRYVDSDPKAVKEMDSIREKDTSSHLCDTVRTDSSAVIKYDKQ